MTTVFQVNNHDFDGDAPDEEEEEVYLGPDVQVRCTRAPGTNVATMTC